MLRRRLLTRIGLLIALFVLGAVAALWQMQRVLGELNRVNSDAAFLMDGVLAVGTRVREVERLGAGTAGPALREEIARLGQHGVFKAPGEEAEALGGVNAALPEFLATWAGGVAGAPSGMPAALEMHARVGQLASTLRASVGRAQVRTGAEFRSLVVSLTLAALVMLNISLLVLLWTAGMILKPVQALVEGSRQLAAERFEHRVRVGEGDEFGELARAYNSLAEQLQANEERRTETLRQLAVTLNHDLNNAMAIIEMQLSLLGREPGVSAKLKEIRASLGRMAGIVASLKNIRRVVLTEYAPGQKMLDLARSVEQPGAAPGGGGGA